MLRLKNIKKEYQVADQKVEALKGISLSFRKNEFVSILGPSGCGKTTTLNIIGGLDKYTSGDLTINGKSTRDFTGRDWDIYRNHRVGFIFQSYNLIPHQTVLGNVELSLTIAGISKEERIEKAKKALDKVGLHDQYYKKPNQLSGGQCQRVAIARALVNEPEILLADEPTGALDTVTSVQIMELIKEISKDKLVIMVTHNPELATKYSSRIIKLLDGEVISDSNPFSTEDEIAEVKANMPTVQKVEKAKMSFWTAFKLSARNLLTKKGRTIMTCIAGSIGIIGISMVLAVSAGVKGFISTMQDDMLSGNPVTITETTMDYNSLLSSMSTTEKANFVKEAEKVNVNSLIQSLIQQGDMIVKNDITKEYVDYVLNISKDDAACINLDYGIDVTNNIYTDFTVDKNTSSETLSLSTIKQIYTSVLGETDYKQYATYVTSLSSLFKQAPANEAYIANQYTVLNGKIATEENEVMVVLDSKSSVTDLVLAQLGYYTQEEFIYLSDKTSDKENSLYKDKFTYDEILGKTFTWYENDQIYNNNQSTPIEGSYIPFTYNSNANDISTEGLKLKIVGILEPKEGVSFGALSSGFYYTEALTNKMLETAKTSEISNYYNTLGIETLNTILISDQFYPSVDENGAQTNLGIRYQYSYTFNGTTNTKTSYVGNYVDYSFMQEYMEGMMGGGSGSGAGLNVANYTLSLRDLGCVDVANSISIYPVDFDTKSNVTAYLDAWNNDGDIVVNGVTLSKDQRNKIVYSDNIALMISMINSMIDMITYALIAFTALSLVVSCVMIAIITYVSVMERVKEIGVIRSLGGRKKDVSHLFNAETFIIGSISGIFGICITYFLSFIINLIVNSLAGIKTIAALPWYQALIMIALSIFLTLISGLIPSRSAAKKDPVTALRSE